MGGKKPELSDFWDALSNPTLRLQMATGDLSLSRGKRLELEPIYFLY